MIPASPKLATKLALEADAGPATIAEALALARTHIAAIAGVSPEAVRLELKIEY